MDIDIILMNNFNYDGGIKKYLVELEFEEARVIFLFRCRMFPTNIQQIDKRELPREMDRFKLQIMWEDRHLFTSQDTTT